MVRHNLCASKKMKNKKKRDINRKVENWPRRSPETNGPDCPLCFNVANWARLLTQQQLNSLHT